MKVGKGKVVLVLGILMSGCASNTPTISVEEAYAIYDIKADSIRAVDLSSAIIDGFKEQTSNVHAKKSIPPYPLPEMPGRFRFEQPKLKGNLAAIMGQMPKQAKCDDAVLTINAAYTGMSSYGERTTFFSCLLPYEGGYHLDIYTTYTTREGGYNAKALGAQLAKSVVGDSSGLIPKTISSVIKSIESTGAGIDLVEVYP